eukprot:Phypoly_transcript_17556.p2 GENE.Phypoly_transcript_17556~~Phypoly_transcript_17556.p2  ORF type:complete len:106 (+),score=5.65 Phypoly_transcript_17556:76-393(+)
MHMSFSMCGISHLVIAVLIRLANALRSGVFVYNRTFLIPSLSGAMFHIDFSILCTFLVLTGVNRLWVGCVVVGLFGSGAITSLSMKYLVNSVATMSRNISCVIGV